MSSTSVAEGVCAACARAKRKCKLTAVEFGYGDDLPAPAWLCWTELTWREHGAQWLQSMHELLTTEAYWRDYFQGPERLQKAREALQHSSAQIEPSSSNVLQCAQRWSERVELWAQNIRADLLEDSVAAPAPLHGRWLLLPSAMRDSSSDGWLACDLCNKCAESFRRVDAQGVPKPSQSSVCRARGLWGGPEPDPIRKLSWVGRRVLQLGRAVICIKTVRNTFQQLPSPAKPMYSDSRNKHRALRAIKGGPPRGGPYGTLGENLRETAYS